jgi:hypothetical protein
VSELEAATVPHLGIDPDAIRRPAGTHPLLQFFEHRHLPPHLGAASEPFGKIAAWMAGHLPDNQQRDAAFARLLEAQDCAVRAVLYREP